MNVNAWTFSRATLCLCLFLAPALGQRPEHFEFVDQPRLIECEGGPCFRITLNALDRNGNPVSLPVSADEAKDMFQVTESERGEIPVFHVRDLSGQGGKRSYSVLLLDVSGSMNRPVSEGGPNRLQAAVDAMRIYVGNIREGLDYVAIAPFESHNVVSTIRRSQFVSDQDTLLGALEYLSRRQLRNNHNTALYTAVQEGWRKLLPYQVQGHQVSLVVLTDGENDVQPGDDPGLLKSRAGIRRLSDPESPESSVEVQISTVTIGFGDEGGADFDPEALQDLAWPSASNYRHATDRRGLNRIFENAWKRLADRLQITLGQVRARRDYLAGKSILLRVRFEKDGSSVSSRGETEWVPPAIGTPVFEDELDAAELDDFLKCSDCVIHEVSIHLLRLLVLLTLGLILAGFWFGLPRLMWPASYAPSRFPAPTVSASSPLPGMASPAMPSQPHWTPPSGGQHVPYPQTPTPTPPNPQFSGSPAAAAPVRPQVRVPSSAPGTQTRIVGPSQVGKRPSHTGVRRSDDRTVLESPPDGGSNRRS